MSPVVTNFQKPRIAVEQIIGYDGHRDPRSAPR